MPTKKLPPGFRSDAARRFTFRLARDLGRTVAELESQISNAEWQEWSIFYALEEQDAELERRKAGV